MAVTYDRLFIGGRWERPDGDETLKVRSPHDQSLTGTAPAASLADVDRAVAAAREAFDAGPWPRSTPAERQAVVRRFAELHAERAREIAGLITSENGSPIWFTSALQESLGGQSDAYLRAAERLAWEETVGEGGSRALVRREPAGVVAAVIPWNAPHQSALVKVIPALLAGCAVILKPSPETALDGLLLGEIFAEAGLPEGVLSILPAGREVSEYLISRPGVDKIAFTGSTAAGRRIAAIAGEQLKRVSLELGGKSASVILDDADLDAAAAGIRFCSFSNNGEACIAHTRILAPRSRYAEAVDALAAMTSEVAVGDPHDPATFVGPMVRADQQARVASYIQAGLDEGARLVAGGPGLPDGDSLRNGFYVRPTAFADVDNSMRIAREEIFGPVISVIAYDNDDDAIRIANDSPYGLGGGVWSTDPGRALAVARRVRTGTFTVNGSSPGWDAPFGGYKSSGLGREFGTAGLSHYVELKSIGIDGSGLPA